MKCSLHYQRFRFGLPSIRKYTKSAIAFACSEDPCLTPALQANDASSNGLTQQLTFVRDYTRGSTPVAGISIPVTAGFPTVGTIRLPLSPSSSTPHYPNQRWLTVETNRAACVWR